MTKVSDEQRRTILGMIQQCILKKMFVNIYDNALKEMYIDSVKLDRYIIFWKKDCDVPDVYTGITLDDWTDAWDNYCAIGFNLRKSSSWRKDIESAKNDAVREWEIGAREKFSIRTYEAMKFVLKDKRLNVRAF